MFGSTIGLADMRPGADECPVDSGSAHPTACDETNCCKGRVAVAPNRSKRASATRYPLALAALSLLALTGCGEQNRLASAPPPKVSVELPTQRTVTPYLEATGNTASENSVKLVARVQGYLREIKYRDGAFVRKGTPLFVIEPEPFKVKLQQAQAAEEGAKAALINAQAEFTRQETLQARDVSTQANLDRARAGRDTDQSNVLQAQANRESAEINLGYTTVSAPFDGVVTARKVSIGELVGGDQPTELASIAQLKPIWVWFNLSEQDVQRVRAAVGAADADIAALNVPIEVELQTESGYPQRGVLDYADPSVDQSTGTLRIRGVFANTDVHLLPGYFVRVRVPMRPIPALLVPELAIGSDQGGRYVLTVNADNVVEQRRVKLGQSFGELRQIESGLKPDERIVVSGILDAIPGQKVDPQPQLQKSAVAETEK